MFQEMYTHGGAAYGSVQNFLKASRLTASEMRLFLQSKLFYTEITLARRKFKTLKAIARFRIEVWWLDLAYADKQAEDKKGVTFLLVRQNLIERSVDAKRTETNESKVTLRALLKMITKQNWPEKDWVDRGKNFAGEFKKVCSAEGKQKIPYNVWY